MTIGSYAAKTRFSSLLAHVARGRRVTVTRHGVPVAMLVPIEARRKDDPAQVIRQIKELRRGRKLKPYTIRQLIEEGRR